jgi:hypothetical protein
MLIATRHSYLTLYLQAKINSTRPPENYHTTAPGNVLCVRLAAKSLISAVANSSAAYNVLYSTRDSHNHSSWAVTTLFIPLSQIKTNSTTPALLSYQIPYDSADLDASPSYALYADPTTYALSIADVSAALGRGWYVNVPDYEGPLASFTAGLNSAHATLDSIRAALSTTNSGLTSKARIAIWAYSGAALASEWATEIQPEYMSDFDFRGAALGGLPPNILEVMKTVTGGPFAGLFPSALVGLTS